MRLNSATMFVASLMMDDDEFLKVMNEWKEEIDNAMKEEENEEGSETALTDGETADGRN